MIDYVKILVEYANVERLLQLPELDFKNEVSESTGELSTKRIADYHYCKVIIYDSGLVLFSGSIHKMYNSLQDVIAPKPAGRGFNGNQFTLSNIVEVRQHLMELLGCDPSQMVFQNIELGINTTPGFKPTQYIKGLLYHIGKPFDSLHNNNYAQARHQRYILKIYNKSNQYGMRCHVLRVEVKLLKAVEINALGIRAFDDINKSTLENAKTLLLKRFDAVVHYDYTINKKNLTERQKIAIKDYANPQYWMGIKTCRRDRPKNELKEITRKHSRNLHQKIRQEIIQKCVTINRLPENPKCVMINTSNIGLNVIQKAPLPTHPSTLKI